MLKVYCLNYSLVINSSGDDRKVEIMIPRPRTIPREGGRSKLCMSLATSASAESFLLPFPPLQRVKGRRH